MQGWQYELFWRMEQAAWSIGVVIIAALVVAIVALIRGLESRADVGGRTEIEELNRSYATGKISIEEYEERKHKAAGAG
jgi:uncharacterized membrane protein